MVRTTTTALLSAALLTFGVGCSGGGSDGPRPFTGGTGGPFSGGTGGPFTQPTTPAPVVTGSGALSTAASLNTRRAQHTATLLTDGQVLVVNGFVRRSVTTPSTDISESSELYDPINDTWTLVSDVSAGSGLMEISGNTTRRARHTATLLGNGQVLIAGGLGVDVFTGPNANTIRAMSSCFLYNPTTQTFAQTDSLNAARQSHFASLANGQVVVTSGIDGTAGAGGTQGSTIRSTELFNPGTGTWVTIGATSGTHTLGVMGTALNQTVVITGGSVAQTNAFGVAFNAFQAPRVEVLTSGSTTWVVGASNASNRVDAGGLTLSGAAVAVVGGQNTTSGLTTLSPVGTMELYDPALGSARRLQDLTTPRVAPVLGQLSPTDDLLIVGGEDDTGTPLSVVEVFRTAEDVSLGELTLNFARSGHTVTRLNDNRHLIVGGFDETNTPQVNVEIHTR